MKKLLLLLLFVPFYVYAGSVTIKLDCPSTVNVGEKVNVNIVVTDVTDTVGDAGVRNINTTIKMSDYSMLSYSSYTASLSGMVNQFANNKLIFSGTETYITDTATIGTISYIAPNEGSVTLAFDTDTKATEVDNTTRTDLTIQGCTINVEPTTTTTTSGIIDLVPTTMTTTTSSTTTMPILKPATTVKKKAKKSKKKKVKKTTKKKKASMKKSSKKKVKKSKKKVTKKSVKKVKFKKKGKRK